MSPEQVQKKEDRSPAGEPVKEEQRVLLNPEEWKEPAGRRVIGEYHKEGLSYAPIDPKAADKSDLESFAGYWEANGPKQLRSEYHKEGAPYMEAPSEWDGHRPRPGRPPNKASEKMAHDSRVRARGPGGEAGGDEAGPGVGGEESPPGGEGGIQNDGDELAGALAKQSLIKRVLDVSTVEVLTFAMFRAIFGRGIRIPLKVEGVIDMEIVAKDKDIVLNTNELQFEVPELSVWRFIFAYKGKPVIEYGRGVKNKIKIHSFRLFVVLLAVLWGSWKKRRAKRKKSKAEGEAAARYASEGSGAKKEDGAGKK